MTGHSMTGHSMTGNSLTGQECCETDAIRDVLHRYCRLLDARDLDALVSEVYAPDATDDRRRGTPRRGQRELRDYFGQALHTLEATAHLLMNVEVSIEGDDASARSRVLACHWFAGSAVLGKARPSECILVGAYTDRLHHFEYGWRIVHREVDALGPAGLLAGLMPESFRGFGGVAS